MVELIELRDRLEASRELWQKRLREAREGGDEIACRLSKGVIIGLTIAIAEIELILKVEIA